MPYDSREDIAGCLAADTGGSQFWVSRKRRGSILAREAHIALDLTFPGRKAFLDLLQTKEYLREKNVVERHSAKYVSIKRNRPKHNILYNSAQRETLSKPLSINCCSSNTGNVCHAAEEKKRKARKQD
jgi:hypothetical protein